MARDILKEIVDRRKEDIQKNGISFGFDIPKARTRKVHPFLAEKGVILEVKRASPSKGDIAPSLDAEKTAKSYAQAGAKAISSSPSKVNLLPVLVSRYEISMSSAPSAISFLVSMFKFGTLCIFCHLHSNPCRNCILRQLFYGIKCDTCKRRFCCSCK